jgi:uncharacterized protein (DUF924 family)
MATMAVAHLAGSSAARKDGQQRGLVWSESYSCNIRSAQTTVEYPTIALEDSMIAPAQDVLDFWFHELQPSDWYVASAALDERIGARFASTYNAAFAGEVAHWRDTAQGRLAEIIVLDQFPRNMFRGRAAAFAADPVALVLSQEAIRVGADRELDDTRRAFLYMPFMHSESRRIHEQAMALFRDLPNLDYEIRHKAIIDRFGRYPHRNSALSRTSTAEELDWMSRNPGF